MGRVFADFTLSSRLILFDDFVQEKEILGHLHQLGRERTTMMIAHRVRELINVCSGKAWADFDPEKLITHPIYTCLCLRSQLNTVMHADKIVVLSDGVVAESGTHEALLRQDGIYAAMWHLQQGDGDSAISVEAQ